MKTVDHYRICAYGSLKTGYWNNQRFGKMQLLGREVLDGIAIFLNGEPHHFAVKKAGAKVEVEVYEVTPRQMLVIHWMEERAGYHRIGVDTSFGNAYMWISIIPRLTRVSCCQFHGKESGYEV